MLKILKKSLIMIILTFQVISMNQRKKCPKGFKFDSQAKRCEKYKEVPVCDLACPANTTLTLDCKCVPVKSVAKQTKSPKKKKCHIDKCSKGYRLDDICKCVMEDSVRECLKKCKKTLKGMFGKCHCISKKKCLIKSCAQHATLLDSCECRPLAKNRSKKNSKTKKSGKDASKDQGKKGSTTKGTKQEKPKAPIEKKIANANEAKTRKSKEETEASEISKKEGKKPSQNSQKPEKKPAKAKAKSESKHEKMKKTSKHTKNEKKEVEKKSENKNETAKSENPEKPKLVDLPKKDAKVKEPEKPKSEQVRPAEADRNNCGISRCDGRFYLDSVNCICVSGSQRICRKLCKNGFDIFSNDCICRRSNVCPISGCNGAHVFSPNQCACLVTHTNPDYYDGFQNIEPFVNNYYNQGAHRKINNSIRPIMQPVNRVFRQRFVPRNIHSRYNSPSQHFGYNYRDQNQKTNNENDENDENEDVLGLDRLNKFNDYLESKY